ncbi:MAG: tripartite tricarboxylate transporter permease [Lachnospirales bacterium]
MILEGIMSVFHFNIILLTFAGTVFGIIFGSIPGISVTMGCALFLPLTFGMEPIAGLALMCGLYIGGTSGGLISAVLLKIPGTAASVATTFDGSPMAERGEAGKALGVGIVFSFLGGMFSLLILIFVSPLLAKIALQFGPYEYFSIAIFSLTMIASLSSGSMVKGLICALFGIFVGFIGSAPITSYPRFVFGNNQLLAGVSMLPVLIGLFAVSQVIMLAEEKNKIEDVKPMEYKIKGFGFSMVEFKSQLFNFFRSAAIGTGIGILPGLGAGVTNIIAYGTAKNQSKHPEKFGTGIIDGIVASETSNNASTGGALVPLMTLGIPGDNTTAILLAAFTIHGIQPGPLLFATNGNLVYGVFTALIIANIFMLITEFYGIRIFVKLLSVPKKILMPVVMTFCVVGAFSYNNRIFDIIVMLIFGVIGYVLNKFKFPMSPIILGFILGPIIEENLLRGLSRSQGSFLPFFTQPISLLFLTITIIVVTLTIIKSRKNKI